MKNIFSEIQENIKTALINKDNITKDCLRVIVSEIKNQTVNANPQKEINDEICLNVLKKSAKTHKDSIEQFKLAGRGDLVEKETAELEIISKFLPKILSLEETRKIIDDVVKINNIDLIKKNMGLIMRNLPKNDSIDKRTVSEILKTMLV